VRASNCTATGRETGARGDQESGELPPDPDDRFNSYSMRPRGGIRRSFARRARSESPGGTVRQCNVDSRRFTALLEIHFQGDIHGITQTQNAQSAASRLEKVRDKLPLFYERDDILLTMIQQRRDVESVNSRNMRLPLQIRVRSKAGLANIDGASSKWTTPSREPRKRRPLRRFAEKFVRCSCRSPVRRLSAHILTRPDTISADD
jgi:hypothetical protein